MDEPTIGEAQALPASRMGFVPVKDWVKRSPGPEDIERGKTVAQELRVLNASDLLIRAALAGYIPDLRCGMTHCFCPLPGKTFRRSVHNKFDPWTPTHEHYPAAARKEGTRRLDNVVLAHKRCNNIGHKLEELCEKLSELQLDPRALQIAFDDHVAQRYTREGLYPRRRAWKCTLQKAREEHENYVAKISL